MPEHIAVRLEQFAHMAVWQVEQQNKELGGEAKKQLARVNTLDLFEMYKLPAPPPKAISIAIEAAVLDRKSTRLNSSHQIISYAVFCLKKKKIMNDKCLVLGVLSRCVCTGSTNAH